jgi:homocysteine S-methyltransferase
MAHYRTALPQLAEGSLMLTDGGLETDLIFNRGIELPHFAACELLRSERGIRMLTEYYNEFAQAAVDARLPFALDTATWRANPDWCDRLGYTHDEFVQVNRTAVELAADVRRHYETEYSPIVIVGVVGPRGDGYVAGEMMSAREAMDYHAEQITIFADSDVDLISALTITYGSEAVGIARAARVVDVPVVISFTIETDGKLPSGETLREAIEAVDAETGAYPSYFMVNCAYPTHLPETLYDGEPWALRVRGYRANASSLSHAELDDAEELDAGNPVLLAREFVELRQRMPQLSVVGGCCGTDARHVRAIAEALA